MTSLAVTLTTEQLEQLVTNATAKALAEIQASSEPEVMTLAECSKLLRRHRRVVMELVRDEELPAYYISEREPRFLRSEVLAWLKSRGAPKKVKK